MFKIGNVEIENRIFLAPMAGYTNLPFRLIARKYGAGAVFTEMISGKGLYYKDKKTAELMLTCDQEAPAGIQLFGSEPEILSEVVEKYINPTDFAFLDFNAGCPAPKIVKNGEGSALMKNPKRLGELVRAIKKVSSKPVIIKTRIGWDAQSINVREVAEVIEDAGADAHTIHGRTREAFYSGTADWKIIGQVKENSKIPVILNGDINSGEKAAQAFEMTGCDALMIGRASVGNPFIFREINHRLSTGETLPIPSPEERIQTAIEHVEWVSLMNRPEAAIKEMRKHLAAYTKGLKNATNLRNEIFKVCTKEEVLTLLNRYMEENYG
ncbi:tRNA dihydrouridine synthase DusB [Eubacterium sp. 1001713B170207_170306_E7]|uniref:tRNA dihydrouridine synthase DusB n=1 Tax=Eubacterium sp. 1001713B170207_170306_E7 TaxID=2787097 RepID=UPI001898E57D|nr:tRNA dihydrouridine synthase DusB [Eubacterium sp. 1001713B170207_170306_E7]